MSDAPLTWTREPFVISTDQARLDLDFVHSYLHDESYWARGIPRDIFERSLESCICFGLYRGLDQIGFARVVTDRAVFAYVGDVFIDQAQRGRGLGVWLVESALAHPQLQGLRTLILGTDDAHGLYRRFGFESADAHRWMVRSTPPRELYDV